MFNLTYAKKCGIPKFAEFETKNEVIEFRNSAFFSIS